MREAEPLRGHWEAVGRIARADETIDWLGAFTGSACVVPTDADSSVVELLITGRDLKNRSLIGRGTIDLDDRHPEVSFEAEPVLGLGSLGAFDENGVSYPCVVRADEEIRLYYTGWMPTVLTPFQNHIGAARLTGSGTFERISRAPLLDRTDGDHLSLGSCSVLREHDRWLMWYTSFLAWGEAPGEPKHTYTIKVATSDDGLRWDRDDLVCIEFEHTDEHSISRPTVIKADGHYHMWYSTRGGRYRLGYAVSGDGLRSTRRPGLVRSRRRVGLRRAVLPPCLRAHGSTLDALLRQRLRTRGVGARSVHPSAAQKSVTEAQTRSMSSSVSS